MPYLLEVVGHLSLGTSLDDSLLQLFNLLQNILIQFHSHLARVFNNAV